MTAKQPLFFAVLLLALFCVLPQSVRAELSTKTARAIITKAAGMSLPRSAVRIRQLRSVSPSEVDVAADLELVFRMGQDENGRWRINEIRAGQDRWESLELVAEGADFTLASNNCNAADVPKVSELTIKLARCLVADLFAVNLPSDEARIKQISGLGLPLGSQGSAVVVTLVQVDFRLQKRADVWQATDFRSGNRGWVNIESLPYAINERKRAIAMEDLHKVANALAAFRKDRGFFVVADKEAVVMDQLAPHYMRQVVRIDPWHKPYLYSGTRDEFSLRSAGPDGKENTSDDIVLTGPAR
ncbi:MAG: type II secretion system protein GspG [Pyrinomonadaceae bacterium]